MPEIVITSIFFIPWAEGRQEALPPEESSASQGPSEFRSDPRYQGSSRRPSRKYGTPSTGLGSGRASSSTPAWARLSSSGKEGQVPRRRPPPKESQVPNGRSSKARPIRRYQGPVHKAPA